jgi:hypothetical protein
MALVLVACTPQESAEPVSANNLPATSEQHQAADPLPSWNEGSTRQAIIEFVNIVTTENGVGFVPPSERIAVFDNDGTLWSEQPVYVQAQFAFDQVRAQAAQHPEWQEQEPFKSVLNNDMAGAMAGGTSSLLTLITATHAGNTQTEFADTVQRWSSPTYPASVSAVASAIQKGTSRMRASVCASSVLPLPVGPTIRILLFSSSISPCCASD